MKTRKTSRRQVLLGAGATVVDTPGAHWTYCGGATALLARMIAKGSGKTLHEFARENLFDPLGMGPTEWATGPDGEPFAASGARMSVRDLARIGVMMLHGGKVDERVVVPADWVTRCITPVISADRSCARRDADGAVRVLILPRHSGTARTAGPGSR